MAIQAAGLGIHQDEANHHGSRNTPSSATAQGAFAASKWRMCNGACQAFASPQGRMHPGTAYLPPEPERRTRVRPPRPLSTATPWPPNLELSSDTSAEGSPVLNQEQGAGSTAIASGAGWHCAERLTLAKRILGSQIKSPSGQ